MGRAVIFDMDGVLVDTEPIWRRVMVAGFNRVGIPFNEQDCRITTGMRFREVVEFWHRKRPWSGLSPAEVETIIIEDLCDEILKNDITIPGAMHAIDYFSGRGYLLGLATSSNYKIIHTVLEKLKLHHVFHSVQSAELLEYGKPHPEVYLRCAHQLQVLPGNCIAVEDSVNGMISAKSAGMKVIVVPEAINFYNPGFSIAELKLKSLNEISSITIQSLIN